MATVTDLDVTVIHNPATGEEVGRVPRCGAEHAAAAVERATRAFPAWWETPAARRGESCARLRRLSSPRGTSSRSATHPRAGKAPARGPDRDHPLRAHARALRRSREEPSGRIGAEPRRPHPGLVLKRPLGVVVAIVPWNFPTTLLGNKLGPALVCGNVIVAKPAETTPLTTLRIAEIMRERGLPEDVFQVVTGKGLVLGEALVTERRVAKVAFTGSTPVGKHVAELAARGVKRVTLELGGSDL